MTKNAPGTAPGLLKPACPYCGNTERVFHRIEPNALTERGMPVMLAVLCTACGAVMYATRGE